MALIQSTAIPSGATAYELEQSLRFNDDDSAYLTKTPSSTGNRKTWTFSTWLKLGNLGANRNIFGAGSDYNEYTAVFIRGDGKLQFGDKDSGADRYWQSDMVFRDTSAWYHLLVAVDTTQGTDTNRLKIYVNGSQITLNNTNGQYSSSEDTYMNLNTKLHWLGADHAAAADFDGYLSEVHFIDGTALTPTSFGETGDYGEWKPIEVSGLTYGTNGFYLSFAGGGVMSATGGNSTATDGDYKAASFTSNGTFTPSADGYVEYLVIAGGGGGGSASDDNGYSSGGGGAGGYRTGYLPVTGGTAYSITVGAGGAGGINGSGEGSNGTQGANSVFSTITSIGGGYGATANQNGGAGGSGGGAAVGYGDNARNGGSATSGQGFDGGGGLAKNNGNRRDPSGGGGGAGQVGYTGSGSTGGNGGNGLASSITGSSVTRAGGGAGDAQTGGSGGGGSGRNNGTANTGSGGGGSSNGTNHGGADGHNYGDGGSGGSGIVIIRYKFQ
jgi:hypothetical protein